jgi:salicylate hydroxylase
VLKSALYERDPLPQWSKDRVTLMGDASHPMLPFMAQGAGMAIEDGVVLGRCLVGDEPEAELRRYEQARQDRTARIQIGSRGNQWMKGQESADWVYGYDAWGAPLP